MYDYWPCKALEVHDGDTVWMELEMGLDTVRRIWVRLANCWAPELDEPGGQAAQLALNEYCRGKVFRVNTYKIRRRDKEKLSFIRYIAEMREIDSTETVSEWMVRMGLATAQPEVP